MSTEPNTIKAKAQQYISVIRLAPFDLSTPLGRSKERLRRAALTTLSSLTARSIYVLATLISVPLSLNYLGTERYGLWMTVTSTLGLLAFADLGIGNGLVNALSEADGRDDSALAKRAVSSGFFMLLAIALFLLSIFLVAYPFIPWERVFNVTSDTAIFESGPVALVVVVCFLLNMPLGVVLRVQWGYQEAFVNFAWQIAGTVFGLAGVLIAIYVRAPLPWLVLAISGMPTLAALANSFVQFGFIRPWLRPSFSQLDWRYARGLLGVGFWFVLIQLMALIGTATDNLVIAQFLGAGAVAGYAVTQKIYWSLVLGQHFTGVFWPAFGEAVARSDYAWARRILKRLLMISTGLGVVVALPLLIFGQEIIRIWAGPDVVPSIGLLAGFSMWMLLISYASAITPFLNSTTPMLRGQAKYYSITALVSVILKIVLVPYWNVEGVIWATVIAYSVLFVVPATLQAYSALNPVVASRIGETA
ncbi:MAG: oligosaccharide flippase family protein [Caldilineaceae bacterium]|nr:oligosaccharide flippase family protein [Caldilineaceae bacterium]